jgi:hypothetical protein
LDRWLSKVKGPLHGAGYYALECAKHAATSSAVKHDTDGSITAFSHCYRAFRNSEGAPLAMALAWKDIESPLHNSGIPNVI